jgi:thioredoxin-like negative regulator of GroEL
VPRSELVVVKREKAQKQKMPIKTINIDYEADVVSKYKVYTIPTTILVEDEKEVRRFTGYKNLNQLINFYNGDN